MPKLESLDQPWLVAVWPGMGHIASSAGYYLMSKLDMYQLAELRTDGVFDIDYAEVKQGLILPTQHPRSRFFAWKAPPGKQDIVLFIGEAQPPSGKYAFCEKVVDFAAEMGVQRIFTFAAMATQMHPEHDSRVFAAATDRDALKEVEQLELERLTEGHIGGLNGVLLGAAADRGMQGICLLGEMPQLFAQVPFPKGSLAVLRVFAEMADMAIDFGELQEQADLMDQKLGDILARMQRSIESKSQPEVQDEFLPASFDEEDRLTAEDEQRIDALFKEAERDRAKAYELKSELDRLEVFKDYEDRFLDLFKK